MPEYIEVVGGPSPNLVESGDLAAPGETPWMPLRGQGLHAFVCEVDAVSSPVGTFLVEARRVRKDGTFGVVKTILSPTTVLTDFPRRGHLAGNWDVKLRCSVYGSGTFNLSITK